MTLAARLLLLFAVVAIAVISLYFLLVKLPQETARVAFENSLALAQSLSKEFQRTLGFTPEILVRDCVLVGKAAPILQLATVEKPIQVETAFGDMDGLTSYSLAVKGEYRIKAGFDLQKQFSLSIDESPTRVIAKFPEPELLSTELVNYTITAEAGTLSMLWRKESKQGIQEIALKRNKARAIEVADSSGILREAKSFLIEKATRVVQLTWANAAQTPKIEFR